MIRLALLVFGVCFVASAALAQSVKHGGLSGTVLSASAVALSGGTDALILTAPATGSFVVTQICTMGTPGSNNESNAQVVGATIGRIAQIHTGGDLGSCTQYTPGFAIPAGEDLRCVQVGASGSAVTCTVTGILSKK
jgi:hypothetical protein